MSREGGFPKVAIRKNFTMPRCAAHKRRRAGRIRFRVRRNRIGLHVPQGSCPTLRRQTSKSVPPLTHTSGIADYAADVGPLGGGVVDMRKDYTENELVLAFTKLPMDFAPGEKWSYSNTDYVLLGIIIGRITGKYYGDFLQERIFRPLDMTSTRIISEADIVPNRSSGYELVNGEIKNQQWVSPTFNTTADGSLYTNVLDLAKWDVALDTKRLLKKSSFDQMWTPVILSDGKPFPYGFGWRIKEVNGHRVIEHSGS